MAPPNHLVIDAVRHPDPAVQAVGFPLDDPYIEDVWVGVIGPTSALLLRRLPRLWHHGTPARVDVTELAASLGISTQVGGWNSQIWRTFRRLADFRLATPIEDGQVGVYAKIAPISDRQLGRLPGWTGRAHDRLLARHLDRLAHPPGVATGAPIEPVSPAARLSARLEQLRHAPMPTAPRVAR